MILDHHRYFKFRQSIGFSFVSVGRSYLHPFVPPMPLSTIRNSASVLLFEYPNVVQSSILLYYKFIRCPHVILDQFVCIAQEDYWRILNHVERNTHKVEEEGEIVMVKEHRELDRSGTRKGHIVIKVSNLKR